MVGSIVCRSIMAVMLFMAFFLLFRKMDVLERMTAVLKRTTREMNDAARQRSLADRQKLLEITEDHSLWNHMDKWLRYSGVKRKFPKATAELWIVANLIVVALLFVLTGTVVHWMAGCISVFLFLAAEFGILKVFRLRNLKRTENNLAGFLDFLGNYSTTGGELTSVLGQISGYMEEPIKGALEDCYLEAGTSGDSGKALLAMAEQVEHPKFKELARNMEISTRYCADFSAMVQSSRRSLREYLHNARERESMIREAIINIVLLAVMSGIVLAVTVRLTGGGL